MAENPTPGENSTIKQMRDQIDEQAKALKAEQDAKAALELKLKEQEDKDLSELERLRKENEELAKQANEGATTKQLLEAANKEFEADYEAIIAGAPEEKRETLRQISQHGDWRERLRSLKAGVALAGIHQPVVTVGGSTQPASVTPQSGEIVPPAKKEEWAGSNKVPGWGDALSKPQASG